jgi:DNA-binding response OmpR family regulator
VSIATRLQSGLSSIDETGEHCKSNASRRAHDRRALTGEAGNASRRKVIVEATARSLEWASAWRTQDESGPTFSRVIRTNFGDRMAKIFRENSDSLVTYRDIELDSSSFSVTFKGQVISFSRREFSLLQKLLENVGHVVSRNSLNQCLYGWVDEIDSNTLEVHVHNLRKKLTNTHYIRTIRGMGYMVEKEIYESQ